MTSPDELDNSQAEIVRRVSIDASYRQGFQRAFGTADVTIDRIAMAISGYERTLLSGDSDYDRYILDADDEALSPAAQRGLELFEGAARCNFCHEGALLTDDEFHNTGVSWLSAGPADAIDLGRFEVTGRDVERGAFRTPSLRDIALTSPYMHDGSLQTLDEVVEFYARGAQPNPFLDTFIRPLELTDRDMDDLVAFLESLSGRSIAHDPIVSKR